MPARALLLKQRGLLVLRGFSLVAFLLFVRLFYLQVIQSSELSGLARAQRTKFVDLSAVRGEIVDRNGKALAASVEAFSVYASPRDAKKFNRKATAERLAPVLNVPRAELERKLEGRNFRWLLRLADDRVYQRIRALKLPGIGVVRESRRLYPKGRLAATLIGFVGIDNQGLAGIEHAFDNVLRGPHQKVRVEVDAYGREILREGSNTALDSYLSRGSQVVLTIDENLQHVAERELGKTLSESGASRGAVIIMDPRRGDLLAFATLPTYDPNRFSQYSWNDIKNWAVTDVYEPGSTFKSFSIAAALNARRLNPNQSILCPEQVKIDGRAIAEHDKGVGTRSLTVSEILETSSNVGTVNIAFQLPASQFRQFLQKAGFGQKTGSGISGESNGILPPLPWRRLTHATVSFGQGISVTPLQILSAAATFGNGGVRVAPRLIDRVVSNKGEVLQTFPVKEYGPVMTPNTAATVLSMMEQVVLKGTGVEAGVSGYRVAGKTGTAQRVRDDGTGYSNDVIASFIGYAPLPNPQFVILTLLDSPRKIHWASQTAAPLFSRVAEEALRQFGTEPTEAMSSPLSGKYPSRRRVE
ncbi:MAG: penicillin-binding protein 2 [Candidatus Sericytochromatia bacterium]|nr:penicillin-binding protein 2 [Candidatus Sericytochromatia bacterium]